MTETEKRRKELLESVRSNHTDNGYIPAVHPRYHNAYHSIYEEEEEMEGGSSLQFRICLALLLFVLYAGADYYSYVIGKWDTQDVAEVISYQMEVIDDWDNH